MPKVSPVQNNFTAGEFSRWLHGRFDISKYSNAAKTLENILIHQAGGAQRRPGTKYVAEVKDSDAKTRLVTFEFSTTQTYILEFGNEYIRFYRNNGQIEAASAYQLTTPYLTAELFDLQFAQDADTMWIVHPNWKPRKLTRSAHNAWTLIDYTPELLTLDVAPGGTGWSVGDTITGVTSEKTCIITEVLTTTTYNIKDRSGTYTLGEVLTNGTNTADQGAAHPTFTLDPFGADGSDDCPSCVAMFEQRIEFANTNNNPQKIWGSVSGNFDNMTVGVAAGDAFVYVIATDKVNAIRWLKPGPRSLLMGTLGATFSLSSGNDALAVTPTNVSVKRDTTYGAANILPETIGNFVYYVGRDLNHLRELGFSFDIDAQQALDMTILADHIAKAADPVDDDGFTQIAYQQSPVSRLWCVRNDGQLAVLTRQIDQEVIGWSRQVSGADSLDNGVYESVAIIPTDGGDDEVWVIVKRYINGSTVRYIEYFMPEKFDHQQDAFFVDSGLSLDSPKTITNIVTKTLIDDMEYASDAAAQNAYVTDSSDRKSLISQVTNNTGEVIGNVGGAQRPAQKITLAATTKIFGISILYITPFNNPTGNVTWKIETDNVGEPSGTLAHASAVKEHTPDDAATTWNDIIFDASFSLPAGTYWIRAYCDVQLLNNAYQIRSQDPSAYADGSLSRFDTEVWTNYPDRDFAFKLYGELALQSYSEGSIKQQGSYSLKAMAEATISLSDTLTRTPATAIDLTGVTSIKLDVRASRTGSNIKIGFHDSGGVTTEHTINIAAADTWQTETIDMSAVTDANKDGIDSIIITILNADADNTFYIDNIYSPTTFITITAASHGLVDADEVRIVDVVGMTEINDTNFIVDKIDADSFAIKGIDSGEYIDGSAYTAYISGGEARERVSTISGLTHLVGEEVAITADGLAVTSKIVSSGGVITLDAKASLVHAGLPYVSDVALLPQPEGSATGTAVGKKQRIYRIIIKLYKSLTMQFGPDEGRLDTIVKTTLFTGDEFKEFRGDWDREGLVLLRQAQPLPMNILSVTLISDVTDD